MGTRVEIAPWLAALENRTVEALLAAVAEAEEGRVMSTGPAPYRRVDCDGRALVYLRPRPRKRGLRLDVSGLWLVPRGCVLRLPTATAAASLLVRNEGDVEEAARYVAETVRRTRAAQTRMAHRGPRYGVVRAEEVSHD